MGFETVIEALTSIITDLIGFIPRMANGLIVLIVGYLLVWMIRWLVSNLLRRLRFDALLERTGVVAVLAGVGVRMPPSQIVSQLLFVFLLLSFLITSTRLMGLEAVAQMLEQLLDFLPQIIAALILFLAGSMAARFVGNAVTAMASASGMEYAARVGRVIQTVITMFTVVLALSQLGVDTAILVTALTIIIAAFGLAIGLSLGLGSRTVIQHILAGYYLRQRLAGSRTVSVGEHRGELIGVGSVNTMLRAPDGSELLIPNSALLDAVVSASPAPAAPDTKEKGGG